MKKKKKMKKVEPVEVGEEYIILNLNATEADANWLQAGRLREKAKKGDKKAARKLKKMENTAMMIEVVDEEE